MAGRFPGAPRGGGGQLVRDRLCIRINEPIAATVSKFDRGVLL